MIIVCLVSYPLCLVPGSEVIEDMLLDSYLQPFIPNQSTLRLVTRSVLVVLTTVVAAKIPSFVLVVSLIGCFCVGVVSFVFPPLFHMRLLQKKYGTESGAPGAKVAVSEASFLLPKSQSAGKKQSGERAPAKNDGPEPPACMRGPCSHTCPFTSSLLTLYVCRPRRRVHGSASPEGVQKDESGHDHDRRGHCEHAVYDVPHAADDCQAVGFERGGGGGGSARVRGE